MKKLILGIETSCDDTSLAIVEGDGGAVRILSNIVSSQVDIHQEFGGVVPEVASRSHLEAITFVAQEAFKKAKKQKSDIDAICVTSGPGLSGSLVVGTTFAKALSWAIDKPVYSVNHIEGHIYANFYSQKNIKFPVVVLVVSGGHTQIVLMENHFEYKVIGKTKDDAAGEAFDKVARILGLPYPGGPVIEERAEHGNENAYNFPRAEMESPTVRLDSGFLEKRLPNLDFSFSGLKTSVITLARKLKLDNKKVNDIAASFQKAVVDVLVSKTIWAAERYSAKTILLSGGVSANKKLRSYLRKQAKKARVEFIVPSADLSTDNAAMIAIAGYFRLQKDKINNSKIVVDPNLKLEK